MTILLLFLFPIVSCITEKLCGFCKISCSTRERRNTERTFAWENQSGFIICGYMVILLYIWIRLSENGWCTMVFSLGSNPQMKIVI